MGSQTNKQGLPSETEADVWIGLNRWLKAAHLDIDAALSEASLPPLKWYDVLWSIEREGASGTEAFKLKEALLFEQSNLSRLLRQLVLEGLIREQPSTRDKRAKVLSITEKGKGVRREMWKVYGPKIKTHLHTLPLLMEKV